MNSAPLNHHDAYNGNDQFAELEREEFAYTIREYDANTGREITVASFNVSDDAILTIVADQGFAKNWTRNGLNGEKRSGDKVSFELDLNEAPIEVVALALGLPGNNPDFRAQLAKQHDGHVSYAQVFNLALEGHPLQSGRIETNTQKPRLAGIDEQKLVHLDDVLDQIPVLPGILGAMREGEADLHIQNVLAKKGNTVIPGYIVTSAADTRVSNLIDRISIMAAYMEEASKIADTKADRLLKVGVLEDGRAYAVFSDSTRNAMNIQSIENSERNPSKVLVVVKREDLYAKKGMELNLKPLGTSERSFSTHFQVNTLNRVIEDRMGPMPSPTAYFKHDGKAHVTMPKVLSGACINALYAMPIAFAANGQSMLRQAEILAEIEPTNNQGLIHAVMVRIRAITSMAKDIRHELENRIDLAKAAKAEPIERFYSNETSLNM
jgi:hypothetical protein